MATQATQARGNARHWAVLVGCCLLIGVSFAIPMLTFGVFIAPMVAFFGCSVTEISIYFTFTAAAAVVSSMLGARILRHSIRASAAICSLIIGLAYMALAAFPSVPMVWVVGAIAGLCYPLCTTVLVPIAINTWFAVRQGTFVGLALAMVGVFGMVFSPLFTAIIASAGWQVALTIAGIAVAVEGCLVGIFLLRESPEAEGLRPYGEAEVGASEGGDAAMGAAADEMGAAVAVAGSPDDDGTKVDAVQVTPADASSTRATSANGEAEAANLNLFALPAFWFCAVAAMFGGFLGDFNSQLNTVAQSVGFDPVVAGLALSCASAGLMVGKLFMGWLKDLRGSTFAIVVGCAIGVVAFTIFVTGTSTGSAPLLYAGAFLSGFCTCLGTLSAAFLSAGAFDPAHYARGVAYITAFTSLGMAVGIPFYSLTFDLLGSYQPILIACIIVPIVTAVVASTGIRIGRRSQGLS